jgi:broad specificity phosphatase PhoE
VKQVILVRHGQSEYMAAGLKDGWTDSPLSELGRKQAILTGKRLAFSLKGSFHFYCSDLARAKETAEIIGDMLPQKPVPTFSLREQNTGCVAHLTVEEAEKMRLPVTVPFHDWIPFPGAESRHMMYNRVVTFMDQIETDTVLMVVHQMAAISIIIWWLQLKDALSKIFFEIDPCSITELRIHRWGEKTVSRLNDTSHLASLEKE